MMEVYKQNVQNSYRKVFFDKKNKLMANPKEVLSDLKVFCHGDTTSFHSDPYQMARISGRREVFIRIMDMLHIDVAEQYDLEPDYPVQNEYEGR